MSSEDIRGAWLAKIQRGLDYARHGILVVDENLVFVFANAAYFEILDLPRDMGQPGITTAADIFRYNAKRGEYGLGEIEDLVAERIRLAKLGEAHKFERTRPDGRVIEVAGNPLPEGGFVTTFTDITDQKRIEAAVLESEERFRAAFHSNHGLGSITELETGRYVDINNPLLTVLGYTREEIIGKTSVELNVWGTVEAREEVLRDIAAQGQLKDYEIKIHPKHGETRDILMNGEVIELSGKKILFLSGTDITDQKRIELQMSAARQEAENANRAKSEFLASMSHELRTPLNAVLGFAQMLQLDPNNPITSAQSDQVDSIIAGGNHLLDLVNDVLDLARIEANQAHIDLEDVDANKVVVACIDQIRPLAERSKISIFETLSNNPHVNIRTDRRRLKQILLNLLSNGVKYNEAGGQVTIDGEIVEESFLRISVTDSGIGIAEQDFPGLFQMFHRLGANPSIAREGTGIGLAVTKLLVERMAGSIGFESELGVGSTFWVELPLVSNDNVLIWDHNMHVGVDAIDKDHQNITTLINRMSRDSLDEGEVDMLIHELTDYARYHFHREEAIMEVCNYPGLAEHKADHDRFCDDLKFRTATWRYHRNQDAIVSFRRFLKDWLNEHIMKVDIEIGNFTVGRSQEIRAALQQLEQG